jgi:hypothetical protein
MLFCPATLALSRQALDYTAGIIRRHRKQTGSPWRKLSPGQQALLVLACLRGETFAGLAAGSGVGTATAWRYVTETVALLAARSAELRRALRDASKAGHACLVIDGTLIPVGRVAADRPFYSGKHRKHGMNLPVIAGPDGDIGWVCGPLPGAVHDLTAARIRGIVRALAASGLVVPGGKGYLGEDDIRTPYRGAEQARIAAGRQPGSCPAARPRRTRQRPAQVLAHRAQAPLLPLARRAAGHGDPRSCGPRNRRMKRLSDWAGPGRQLDRIPGGNVVTCADVRASSVPRRPRAADARCARGRWGAGPARGHRTQRGPHGRDRVTSRGWHTAVSAT